jgi:hypothetical protein
MIIKANELGRRKALLVPLYVFAAPGSRVGHIETRDCP